MNSLMTKFELPIVYISSVAWLVVNAAFLVITSVLLLKSV